MRKAEVMKKLFLSLSVIFVLLLTGCTGTLKPATTTLYTGQGETLVQLKKACDMNDLKRCVTLGVKLTWLQDYQNAEKYFDKTCKMNVAEGCLNLGILYRMEWLERSKDIKKSKYEEYIKKGCMMGVDGHDGWGAHVAGCRTNIAGYATRLRIHDMLYPSYKNPPDLNKLKKACSLNDSTACVKVGIKYYKGYDDLKQDYLEARKYFKKACDLNSGVGCRGVASTYIDNRGWKTKINRPEVFKYLRKACDLNNAEGCYILGHSYMMGKEVTKDDSKAMSYFKKACKLNYGWACKKYEQLKKEGH